MNNYRCTLIPANLLPEQVEQAADSKTLPTVMVHAQDADAARGRVHRATGKRPLAMDDKGIGLFLDAGPHGREGR